MHKIFGTKEENEMDKGFDQVVNIINQARENAFRKVVEYAMSRTMSPMMVSQYQLQLPDKEVLRKKLQELANIPQIEDEGKNED